MGGDMVPKLSAFIIAKNEARDIVGCLASLKGVADEVVVVDDSSIDRTAEICREWGARVFSRRFDGYATQKQYAMEQCTGQWLLSMDADERVTPALAREFSSLGTNSRAAVGFLISRHLYFLGRRLRFGGVGRDWVLRLIRRGRARFRPLQIHEALEVDGPVERLSGAMDHFSYATLDEYLEKIPRYTAMAAQARWEKGKRFHVGHHLRPLWELFSRVVLEGAWLDGEAGIIYALLSSHAAWLRSAKLWEMENAKSE
jgi:glycosyltransferase involved in cell wall biosynthesis